MKTENAEYRYIICRDIFEVYHPNEEYTIKEVLREYKIKPTSPTPITYIYDYNNAVEDFKKFYVENDLKCRHGNGLHDETFCSFNVLVLYDEDWQIKGFAARCIKNGNTKKDIVFL